MQQPSDDALRQFLSSLWPTRSGELVVWVKPKSGFPVSIWKAPGETFSDLPSSEQFELYFSVCSQDWRNAEKESERRGKDATRSSVRGFSCSVHEVPCLWLDIDCREGEHSSDSLPTLAEAERFLDEFEPAPSAVVKSGGGFHAYWFLRSPITLQNPEEWAGVEAITKGFQTAVRQDFEQRGWDLDSTGDLARVLRLPGTYNHKTNPPKPVLLLKCDSDLRYSIEEFTILSEGAMTSDEKSEAPSNRAGLDFSPPDQTLNGDSADSDAIIEQCAWARHCRDDAKNLKEPEWFALLSIISRCNNPVERAKALSEPHAGYTGSETLQKLFQARQYGPRTCGSIQRDFGSSYCATCPHKGEVRSPIVLGTPGSLPHSRHVAEKTVPKVSKEDFQAAFEPRFLRAARRLQRDDPHKYIQVRRHLADARVPLGEWDKAVKRVRRKLAKDHQGSNLPEIVKNGRQLRDIFDDGERAIVRGNKESPTIFRYGGLLSEISSVLNGLQLTPLTTTRMYGLLTRHADWFQETPDGDFPTKPDRDVASELVEKPSNRFPLLRGITHAPLVDCDGTIVCTPGYNPAARMYLHLDNMEEINVPESPTEAQVESAVSFLLDEVLGDFPFETESDRTHFIGALLTPLLRSVYRGTSPLHSIEAPSPGSGKGLLADICGITIQGRRPSMQTLARDDDEMRKRLTAALIEAPEVICLDNLPETGRLDSAALASVLTSSSITDRILGQTKMVTFPNQSLWLATANNPRFSTEIARRTVRVRLNPDHARPWQRTGFKHPDLREWVSRHRREVLEALLTLCRNWFAVGCPTPVATPLGSYEEWSRVVGGVLEAAGLRGFLDDRDSWFDIAETQSGDWSAFVREWWKAFGRDPVRASDLATLCEKRGALSSVIGDGGEKSQSTRLGRVLAQMRDRIFDGFKIRFETGRRNGNLYRIEPLTHMDDRAGFEGEESQ